MSTPYELQATANALSASRKMKPPWAIPTPLIIVSVMVITAVACPGPTSSITIPRADVTLSVSIIRRATDRARLVASLAWSALMPG